ncbi:MAG: hypothetical protein JSS29_18995 [Proteobacteria bacterium]|nr:hypothetical protein [Pseudomonadota bacterium]
MSPTPTRWLALAAALATTLVAAGCNNSSSDSGSGGTTQSATGIWSGTDSTSGLSVTALIDSAGRATFIRGDGVQFTGDVQVSGSTLAATVDGYPDFSATFSDGSDYGIGTLSGTVSSGGTLAATLAFTTNSNTSITGNWSLTYESLSDTASSVGAMSGSYADSVTGTTYSFSTTGSISGTNTSNGCTLSGSVSTADPTHNIYQVAYTYSGCTGTYESLNGVPLTGLGTINSTLSPAQILLVVTGSSTSASTSTYYGLVTSLAATS